MRSAWAARRQGACSLERPPAPHPHRDRPGTPRALGLQLGLAVRAARRPRRRRRPRPVRRGAGRYACHGAAETTFTSREIIMSHWIVALVSGLLGLLGIFLPSRAVDGGMYVFGFAVPGFGILMGFGLRRHSFHSYEPASRRASELRAAG